MVVDVVVVVGVVGVSVVGLCCGWFVADLCWCWSVSGFVEE